MCNNVICNDINNVYNNDNMCNIINNENINNINV